MEINPKSLEEKQPFLKSFSGFSRRDPRHLKCGHCGQKGHIISQCPGMERRVSLTRGGVMLTPRGRHEPESVVNDEVSPGDSISQVGLTSESLRLHNKRLRGDGWTADEQPKSPARSRQRTEMKPPATPPKREGRPQAAGSTAAVVTGPKPPPWGGSSRLRCRRRQRGHHLIPPRRLQRRQQRHHRQRRHPRRHRHLRYRHHLRHHQSIQLSPRHHPRRPRRRKLQSPHRQRRVQEQSQYRS